MLAEVLADRGDWSQVMPGVRACLFSLEKSPLPLPLRLEPLHFEALFCVAGTVTLTRRDGSALTAGARQVLLLTDASSLSAVCTACRSTPGCGSGGWNGRQSCCGTPPSVFWGWLSQSDMAVPASSPPPSAGSTV